MRRALAYLDRDFPGWENWIDLDMLDQGNGHRCVAAQMAWHDKAIWNWEDFIWRYSDGKEVFSSGSTEEWKEEILKRRSIAGSLPNRQ